MDNIFTYLEQNLSHRDFDSMVKEFGKKKYTRLANGTDDNWNVQGLRAVAKYVKEYPSDIIKKFNLNIDVIPIGAVRAMLQEEGKVLEFATHVA